MTEDFQDRKNTGRVIVAIPTATEPVHHLGDVSEPKHMTLVWLGKPEDNPDLDMDQVRGQVEAVAERSGPLTGLVESTGPLGDDGATVWHVRGDGIEEVRNDLLSQSYIKDAFGAAEQHPGFVPHVTAGYNLDEPLSDDDSPEEIIFDRLALWDGDEHTEFPLGPSASSEENTDGPEATTPVVVTAPAAALDQIQHAVDAHAAAQVRNQQVNAGVLHIPETMTAAEMGLSEDFEAALVEAMTKPLTCNDAESLAAAVEQCNDGCGTAQMATRPILMKRARELGCQHLIPTSWLRQRTSRAAVASQNSTAVPAPEASDVRDPFELKTQLSTLSDTALRAAYMRGVREFTMVAPQSRPPLPRDVIAQARVNSLIRLAQGDLSARTDDRDLLR